MKRPLPSGVPASSTGRTRTYLLQDELTGARAIDLADRLAALPVDEIDTLVLCLSGVGAVDASGVAILVRLYSRLVRNGKRLVLRDIPEGVERVLRRVGLGSVFAVNRGVASSGLFDLRPLTQSKLSPVPAPAPETKPAPAPPPDDYDPSVEDLVGPLSRMEAERAIHLLRTVVERLGLSAEGVGLQQRAPSADQARIPTDPAGTRVVPPAASPPVVPLPAGHAAPPPAPPAPRAPAQPTPEPPSASNGPARAAVLRSKGTRPRQQALSASSMGLRWGPEPARVPHAKLAGSRTESFGWAWWDFLFATQNLPLPTATRDRALPRDLRALLLDYLEGDGHDGRGSRRNPR